MPLSQLTYTIYKVASSSCTDAYFLKQLVLPKLTQQSDKQFHLSTTLLLNVYLLISNLQRSLNNYEYVLYIQQYCK